MIKINFNVKSLLSDTLLTALGMKSITVALALSGINAFKTKLRTFLSDLDCFPNISQNAILSRNIELAGIFVGLTSEIQEDAEAQFLFIKKQLESSTLSDLFLKIAKPTKKLSPLTFNGVFTPKEVEIYQNTLKKIDKMLPSVFDYEVFAIALIFHTEQDEMLPLASSFRHSLLRVLQNRLFVNSNNLYDTNMLYSSVIEDLAKISQFNIFQ